jgi:hypothetical protein
MSTAAHHHPFHSVSLPWPRLNAGGLGLGSFALFGAASGVAGLQGHTALAW